MASSVMLELPAQTYQQLAKVAQGQKQSIPDVLQNLLAQEKAALPQLPAALEAELAAFTQLSDHVLWILARSTLTMEEQADLAQLNAKAQEGGKLTTEEQTRQSTLLDLYHSTMIRRAEAANVLRQRGHDISSLFTTPAVPHE